MSADLLDPGSLRAAIEEHGVQAVFHLAATAIVGSATTSPLSTYEVNVRGTWNLLEACRLAEKPPGRVVVASTDKAYGVHENLPYREDHALQPHYPYDASKACADIIARSCAHTFDRRWRSRGSATPGGGDFNFSRLIPGTVEALLAGERPVIRSNGLMERDFLYAEDAVTAYLAVAGLARSIGVARPRLECEHRLPGERPGDRDAAHRASLTWRSSRTFAGTGLAASPASVAGLERDLRAAAGRRRGICGRACGQRA